MYKATEIGKVYYTVKDKDSKWYDNSLVIDLENATQEELKMLFEINHPFVVKDEPKSKKAVE